MKYGIAFVIIRLLLNEMHKYSITNALLAINNQPLTAKACYPPEIIVKHAITNPTNKHYFKDFQYFRLHQHRQCCILSLLGCAGLSAFRCAWKWIPLHNPRQSRNNQFLINMKKTIIALLAIGSVAMADSIYWDQAYSASSITLNRGNGGINLSGLTEGALDIANISGYFISKVNSDTSPALGKVDITFTLTDVTTTNTLFTIASDSAALAGWGVTIKDGSLYLGQMTIHSDETTSVLSS